MSLCCSFAVSCTKPLYSSSMANSSNPPLAVDLVAAFGFSSQWHTLSWASTGFEFRLEMLADLFAVPHSVPCEQKGLAQTSITENSAVAAKVQARGGSPAGAERSCPALVRLDLAELGPPDLVMLLHLVFYAVDRV